MEIKRLYQYVYPILKNIKWYKGTVIAYANNLFDEHLQSCTKDLSEEMKELPVSLKAIKEEKLIPEYLQELFENSTVSEQTGSRITLNFIYPI